MKVKLLYIISLFFSPCGFAQPAKSILKDDLIQGKDSVLARFIPMANGGYLYEMYSMPPVEFIHRINKFKASLNAVADTENNNILRQLKKADIDAYARNVISWYTSLYGMDSLGMVNLRKVVLEKKGDPDYAQILHSANEKAFVKELSPEEKTRLTDMFMLDMGLNEEELFKHSAAYRKWIDNYIDKLRKTKYKADTALGYQGFPIVRLKIVNAELTNPFIKQYLNYELIATILKSVKNIPAKETAYSNFMLTATDPLYRSAIQEIYANYKRMTANAAAPGFTYTTVDNRSVSLTDLRDKYVYIDIWATWCVPCRAEIPFLTKVEEEYKDKNIHFVSLSVDRLADKAKWQTYVKEHDLQGIQLMADKDFDSDFIRKFNINSIPRFILIDPAGKIVSGDAPRPSDPALRLMLDKLLE